MLDNPLNNKIKLFKLAFSKFLLPFIVVSLFYVVRVSYIDQKIELQVFSLTSILVVVLTAVGGMIGGLATTFYATFLGTIIYINTNLLELTSSETNRVITMLITGIILSLFVGTFFANRKKLQFLSSNLNTHTERLRNVIDSVFTIILIIDEDGNILEANKTYADYLPENWEELPKKNIFNLSPWADDSKIKKMLRKAVKNVELNKPIKYEDIIKLGGKPIFAEINVVLVEEYPRKEIVVTVRDRTDRKLYEDEINKKNEIFAKLIDSNIVGMIIGDPKGLIIETNDAFLNMLGYTPEEFEKGLNCIDITPPEYLEKEAKTIAEIYKSGYAPPIEKEFFHKNGSRVPVIISGIKISEEDQTILCIVIDLTVQKDAQRKKDEFISIASHKLKTPMTIIKGYLQILNKKYSQNVDSGNFLNIIDFQLNKLNTLVNELHDMSKIESKKLRMSLEEVDLNNLVKNAIEEVKPFIDNQQIRLIEKDKSIIVNVDIIRIEQVMVNLLTNALKYSPNDSEITVTVSKEKDSAKVEVKDQGIGISEEDMENVFTKFFQVEKDKELKEGLGLGLYISSEIIAKHNGKIKVESELGKGSTFSFTLPLT